MTEEQNKLAKTNAELAEEIEQHLLAHCVGVPTPVIGIDLWAWKRIIAALREPATEAVLEPVCLAGNLLCPHPLTCAGEVRCFTAPIQVRDYVLKLEHALKGKRASQGDED